VTIRFARLLGAVLSAAILSCASCPPATAAGFDQGGLFGFRLSAERFSIGEWVAYWTVNSIPGAQRDTVWQRIAIVARDSANGHPAHWIELATYRGTRVVMKALVLDDALGRATATPAGIRARTAGAGTAPGVAHGDDELLEGIVRLILKRGEEEPIELRLPHSTGLIRSLIGRVRPDYDPADIVRDDSLDLGEEDLTMPRGRARGRHGGFVTVIEPGRAQERATPDSTAAAPRQTVTFATDVWTSPDVPITGVLRTVSRTILRPPDPGREVERSETFLDGYGIGATSEITGRVRLISPPRTLVRPSR
jgi:hypothetical protein